ncbi:dihydrofolate reductase family protein [Paenibacillus terreus]|uniref:Dihydrofolate reductase family protein n=1 Tax=Paenibacillus terreus TaxID=1387834 RepID=A0ABV5B5Q8_9BACL
MGEIIITMQMSLDGVVSQEDRWMLLSDEILEDYLKYYKTVDALVVGGNTYEGLAQYWPNAESSSDSPIERAVAKSLNDHRKFVFTRSENDLTWRNSEPVTVTDDDSFVREMEKLKNKFGKISVESGVKTWQRCIQHRLFDELWVLVHPVIAAEGDKLFALANAQQPLKLVKSKTYQNGVLGLHYQKG